MRCLVCPNTFWKIRSSRESERKMARRLFRDKRLRCNLSKAEPLFAPPALLTKLPLNDFMSSFHLC